MERSGYTKVEGEESSAGGKYVKRGQGLKLGKWGGRIGGVVFLLIAASPAFAILKTVCATGCDYTTIQAAINAVGDVTGTGGYVIEIRDSGTYNG